MDLRDELFIDDSSYANLNEEFKEHAIRHSKWLMLAAEARKNLSTLRLQAKVLSAKICDEYAKQYLKDNGKQIPVSFNMQTNVLPKNEEWIELAERIIEAENELSVAEAACTAFKERGYALREIGEYMKLTAKEQMVA